jgi:hypothetical protein
MSELGMIFLFAAHLVWFAIPAVYQAFVPSLWFGDWVGFTLSDAELLKAAGLIALFFAVNVAVFVAGRPGDESSGADLEFRSSAQTIGRAVKRFFVIGIAPYVLLSGSLSGLLEIFTGRGDKNWGLSPESGYEASALMTFFWTTRSFLVASAILASCTLVMGRRLSPLTRSVLIGIAVLATAMLYFDQGTRSIVAMAVLPAVTLKLVSVARSRNGGEIRRTRLITGAISVGALLLVGTQLQLYYRDEARRMRLEASGAFNVLAPRQQIDFFTETACAVVVRDDVLAENLGEYPLLMFVANVVPRALWPGKPMPETLWHYSMTRWGRDIWLTGGNALPSVVGQYYINRGYLGVFWIAVVYGWTAAVVSRWISAMDASLETVIAGTSVLAFLAVSFRYLSPGFHYAALILLAWEWFTRHRVATMTGQLSAAADSLR